jgi:MFS family permease
MAEPAPALDLRGAAARPARAGWLHLRLLNIGHLYDHWFILIFATAVIAMTGEFGLGYAEMMALSTPGFLALGLFAMPAGWLGDRWSRRGMMAVFFLGLGAASVLVGLARTPLELAVALTLLGIFAAIYHPVAIAMVSEEGPPSETGRRLGVNGVWGNMGIAGAAIVTGAFVDLAGWRSAFILPGLLSIATGLLYLLVTSEERREGERPEPGSVRAAPRMRAGWQRALIVVAAATTASAIIFNGVTIAMPMVFQERIAGIVTSATGIGAVASGIYALAAFSQMVVGSAIDRFAVRPLLSLLATGQILALGLAAFATDWLLIVASLVMMVMVFGQVPVASTLIARYTPNEIRARVFGLQFLLTFGIGALAVPLISVLHGRAGFSAFFLVLAALAGAILAVAQALPDPRPGPSARPAGAVKAEGQ